MEKAWNNHDRLYQFSNLKINFVGVFTLPSTIVVRLLLVMFLIFLLFRMSWRVIVIVLSVTGEVPHCKNFTTICTYTYAHTTHTRKIHPCRACTHAHVHAHTYVHIHTQCTHIYTMHACMCTHWHTHAHTCSIPSSAYSLSINNSI